MPTRHYMVSAKPMVALLGELDSEVATPSLEMHLLAAHKLELEQQALDLALVASGPRS
jgi:hypothetical protein